MVVWTRSFYSENAPSCDPNYGANAIVPPDFPKEWRNLLEKALAKKPEDRLQSCGEFRDAMFQEGVTPSTHAPYPTLMTHLPRETSPATTTSSSLTAWDSPPHNTFSFAHHVLLPAVLVLALTLGVWTTLKKQQTVVDASYGRGAIFLPKQLGSREFRRHDYILAMTKHAIEKAEQYNWGQTRYFLRIRRKFRTGCYWLAHWVHHTINIFRQTCEGGDKTACHWLKVVQKKKLPQDYFAKKAIPIYRKACQQKEARACHALGLLANVVAYHTLEIRFNGMKEYSIFLKPYVRQRGQHHRR